jgi:integrase/recombinase XerD
MTWKAKIINHRNQKRIAVYFEKNKDLIDRIKKLADSKWSQSLGVWHLPDTNENRLRFKIQENNIPNAEAILGIEKFRKHLL